MKLIFINTYRLFQEEYSDLIKHLNITIIIIINNDNSNDNNNNNHIQVVNKYSLEYHRKY